MAVGIARGVRSLPERTGTPPTWLRGTNYLTSTALGLNNVLGTLPALTPETRLSGFYWGPYVEQEIAEIARAGFNNIRLHTASFLGWALDPDAYMQSLANLARTCAKHEITITYQFWTTTTNARGHEDLTTWTLGGSFSRQQLHSTLERLVALYKRDARPLLQRKPGYWVNIAEPGPLICSNWVDRVPREWKKLMMDYVAAIADFFANTKLGRDAFGSYDLFNEPDVYDRDDFGNVLTPLRTSTLPLILDTEAELSRVHPNSERTIGFASLLDRPPAVSPIAYLPLWLSRLSTHQTISYLSFHADVLSWPAQSVVGVEATRRYRIPMVVSEFWHTLPSVNQAGLFRHLKDGVDRVGAGGQMWGYLESNAWDRTTSTLIDGIIKPVLPASLQLTAPLSFGINHPVDHAAVLDWTSKKRTRRH